LGNEKERKLLYPIVFDKVKNMREDKSLSPAEKEDANAVFNEFQGMKPGA
jgi:hypothetical protein